jgi:SAM-dependent methyltransferase
MLRSPPAIGQEATMVKLDLHYVDPRLVELYDLENTRGADVDFYLQLAADLGARRIIDLGCGTGLLTRELAIDGRQVTGVDPSPAMLAVARRGAGANRVRWIEGDSTVLGQPEADLVTMTGAVAQVFLEDTDWLATLRDIHAALRPGGYVAFESRNPDARAWESWNHETTRAQLATSNGPVETWLEVVRVDSGRVLLEGHNAFTGTGEEIVASSELRFRSNEELTSSLTGTGFVVEHIYGTWEREPFVSTSRIMVFVARRN